MRIALICPSNMMYMPYVLNYTKILDEKNIRYDIINWDRIKTEAISKYTYRDSKTMYQRGLLDYVKYSKFILNKLKTKEYDKVIVFGFQLLFFINRYLSKNFRDQYIIDIRDYHRMIHYFNFKKVVSHSAFTVISSPGYKQWLPKSNQYVINHNSQVSSLDDLCIVDIALKGKGMEKGKITVNYIGAIREYQQSIDLINALKDSNQIQLKFHGEGFVNKDIENYLKEKGIHNIELTGRYLKEQEPDLYSKSDFISVLEPNDCVNSKTLMPNRIYNAVLYGKPVLAFEGSYLAEIVKKYHLGLVIDSFVNVEDAIMGYLKSLDVDVYNKGRKQFFDFVIRDNEEFKKKIEKFILRKD